MSLTTCEACGSDQVSYRPFSGGTEYWCRACESAHPYPEELLLPRLRLLREGRQDELRARMRAELAPPPSNAAAAIVSYYLWLQDDAEPGEA